MNNLVIVGRLVDEVEVVETETKKYGLFKIAVTRNYKNIDGAYETDFIPCKVCGTMLTNVQEYLNKGDLIGVKGSIQSNEENIYINVEKLTFLSNGNKSKGEEL